MPIDNLNLEKSYQAYLKKCLFRWRIHLNYTVGGLISAFSEIYFMSYLMSGKNLIKL